MRNDAPGSDDHSRSRRRVRASCIACGAFFDVDEAAAQAWTCRRCSIQPMPRPPSHPHPESLKGHTMQNDEAKPDVDPTPAQTAEAKEPAAFEAVTWDGAVWPDDKGASDAS